MEKLEQTDGKSEYMPEILELAERNAREMILSGEEARRVKFGWGEGGYFWLSADRDKAVGTRTVEVDGRIFYIGLFGEEKERPG